MAKENTHIFPLAGEYPSQFAERMGRVYAEASVQKDKKNKGQFFTPLPISCFMGRLATPRGHESVSVIDPGCGMAILSCALIEHLIETSSLKRVSLTVYDTDTAVLPFTEEVLQYLVTWCADKGAELTYQVEKKDFVLEN